MPDDKKSIRITIDQIDETLQQNVDLGDAARAAGVDVFLQLTQARDANLVREFSRLRQILPANDPRLAGLTMRLDASTALRQKVAFDVLRSGTGTPSPVADAWTLHGFIRSHRWYRDANREHRQVPHPLQSRGLSNNSTLQEPTSPQCRAMPDMG